MQKMDQKYNLIASNTCVQPIKVPKIFRGVNHREPQDAITASTIMIGFP